MRRVRPTGGGTRSVADLCGDRQVSDVTSAGVSSTATISSDVHENIGEPIVPNCSSAVGSTHIGAGIHGDNGDSVVPSVTVRVVLSLAVLICAIMQEESRFQMAVAQVEVPGMVPQCKSVRKTDRGHVLANSGSAGGGTHIGHPIRGEGGEPGVPSCTGTNGGANNAVGYNCDDEDNDDVPDIACDSGGGRYLDDVMRQTIDCLANTMHVSRSGVDAGNMTSINSASTRDRPTSLLDSSDVYPNSLVAFSPLKE
ncbi:unnamed protein product [Phytophthora fragariaefolia]|uniref:Unnamed protein product n=1 Tax=Phytophthora fragariaefolia TaxID=1490495 RepID=A0A9W6Y4C7_9STRA|nr:unnamed protein product [Phytophthora fragariaefolia]